VNVALIAYLVGVIIGLWRTDGTPLMRCGLALLWPVGPAAFLGTIAVLLAASLVAFPAVGAVAAVGALVWWLIST